MNLKRAELTPRQTCRSKRHVRTRPQPNKPDFEFYPSARIGALAGVWKGAGSDYDLGDGRRRISFRSEMYVRVVSDRFQGNGVIYSDADPSISIPIVIDGGFINEDRMLVGYRSADPARKQEGTLILHLSACATELEGSYNGNSPVRSSNANGHIQFKKTTSL